MKKLSTLIFLIPLLLLTACHKGKQCKERKQFCIDVMCPHTRVQDQGRSNACWVYAMLATIESDRIVLGDSIHLSPHYTLLQELHTSALRRFLSHGRYNSKGRGTAPRLLHLLDTDGTLPYDAFRAHSPNYAVVRRHIYQLADHLRARGTSLTVADNVISDMLQKEIAPLPPRCYLYGMPYTPQQLSHSLCRPDNYVAMTSYQHHVWNSDIDLEVPDNEAHDAFRNVDVHTLMHTVIHTLEQGYPVCWEGDTSEPGFSFSSGMAETSDDTHMATDREREADFSRSRTTDDHCMELIGLAHDRQGHRYVVCKNSWGTDNPYGGLMFMSLAYLQSKTVAVVIHRDHLN